LFVPTKKTTTHGSPWSKEDVKELKAHSKARTPVAKIAKAMKRTEGALSKARPRHLACVATQAGDFQDEVAIENQC